MHLQHSPERGGCFGASLKSNIPGIGFWIHLQKYYEGYAELAKFLLKQQPVITQRTRPDLSRVCDVEHAHEFCVTIIVTPADFHIQFQDQVISLLLFCASKYKTK